MIHERDYRQKNRQTPHDSIDWACIASRGKNASQHIPVYLQVYNSFQVIRTTIAKYRHFYVPRPSFFVCPGDAPVAITQNVAWMKRQFSAPNPSQHVPIYLQQFPSYSNCKCKNRRFHVPQPTFLFPLETPLRLSRNMLHGWKDNSMLAKPLAACTYLSSIFSELYDA